MGQTAAYIGVKMTSNSRFTTYSTNENLWSKNQYFSGKTYHPVHGKRARFFCWKNNATIHRGSSIVAVVSGRVSQWFENTMVQNEFSGRLVGLNTFCFPLRHSRSCRFRRSGTVDHKWNVSTNMVPSYPNLSRSVCVSTTDRFVIDICSGINGFTRRGRATRSERRNPIKIYRTVWPSLLYFTRLSAENGIMFCVCTNDRNFG